MAHDQLQELLGSNPRRQQEYLDFLKRYQNDPNSVSDAEAARRYHEMMSNAPADMAADAHTSALDQLSPAQRGQIADQYKQAHDDPNSAFDGYQHDDPQQAADSANLGRMSHQAAQQSPDLFDKVFGQGSPLGGTLGKLAMAGVAAYMASRVLGGNGQGGINAPGGGLGGLLGALGGQGNAAPAPSAQPGLHVKGNKQG